LCLGNVERMGGPAPLALMLDLSRAQNAGEPHGFEVARPPQIYLLRGRGGSLKEVTLSWDQSLLDDLAAPRLPRSGSRGAPTPRTAAAWLVVVHGVAPTRGGDPRGRQAQAARSGDDPVGGGGAVFPALGAAHDRGHRPAPRRVAGSTTSLRVARHRNDPRAEVAVLSGMQGVARVVGAGPRGSPSDQKAIQDACNAGSRSASRRLSDQRIELIEQLGEGDVLDCHVRQPG